MSWLKSEMGAFSSSAVFRVAIVWPSLRFSVATPVPVTTISSIWTAVTLRAKSSVRVSPAATVTVSEASR